MSLARPKYADMATCRYSGETAFDGTVYPTGGKADRQNYRNTGLSVVPNDPPPTVINENDFVQCPICTGISKKEFAAEAAKNYSPIFEKDADGKAVLELKGKGSDKGTYGPKYVVKPDEGTDLRVREHYRCSHCGEEF